MESLTCPGCQGDMHEHRYGQVAVQKCGSCGGVFLARTDLGALVEAENDWHSHQSANTATLPRIDFNSPPPPMPARSRSFLETLFKL